MPTSHHLPIHLVALDGGPDLVVDRDPLLVGRDPRCDARIDSSRVSRIHCYLSRHRDEIFVRDLGSTNGTLINGRRTASGRLRPGDDLSIAEFRYRLEAGRAAEGSHLSPRAGAPGPDPATTGRSNDAARTALY
jgi:predicted component of type VI protein secretion system